MASSPDLSTHTEPTPPVPPALADYERAYWGAVVAAQFQGGFLARTAHELRSPLNSILSLNQIILEDLCEDPTEEREFVAQASLAAKRLLALLDQATTVSKMTIGRIQPVKERVAIAPLFDQVRQLTQLQADDRSIRLEVSAPTPTLAVQGDAHWLVRILVALIEASLDQAADTVRLWSNVIPNPHHVQLCLSDGRSADGWVEACPLSDTLQPGVGEPGAKTLTPLQLQPGCDRTSRQASTNLALWLAQQVLEQLGGQLTLAEDQDGHPYLCLNLPICADGADF